MPARIELACETLSHLWTGGSDQTIDRVHETGLLGSMRWWFEAFLRGVGARACDPASHDCIYDRTQPHGGICQACREFGATGWQRRFRLTVRETGLTPVPIGDIRSSKPPNPNNNNKVPTWYFSKTRDGRRLEPLKGGFTLVLDDLDGRTGPDHLDLNVIAGLLQFMADWAGIGARNQMGFGRFRILNGRHDTTPFYNYLVGKQGTLPNTTLPGLNNIFFATIRAPSKDKSHTFDLKHDLRNLFRGFPGDRQLRHNIMGTTEGPGIGAKIKMSWPDASQLIHVWGWLPAGGLYPGGWDRNRVANLIHGLLATHWNLQAWREAATTTRNTPAPATNGVDPFLRALL